MTVRLGDPWFEAQFYTEVTATGFRTENVDGTPIAFGQAQGLMLWCPCGYSDPRYHEVNGGRPHAILVPFANGPGGPVPLEHGPIGRDGKTRPRWTVTGSSLEDITIAPSIAVASPECWHGYIQGGRVTGC